MLYNYINMGRVCYPCRLSVMNPQWVLGEWRTRKFKNPHIYQQYVRESQEFEVLHSQIIWVCIMEVEINRIAYTSELLCMSS